MHFSSSCSQEKAQTPEDPGSSGTVDLERGTSLVSVTWQVLGLHLGRQIQLWVGLTCMGVAQAKPAQMVPDWPLS